jgi:hypothetical protein
MNSVSNKLTNSSVCRLLLVVDCLAYTSTVKMEAIISSQTTMDYQNTRRHAPDDTTPHCRRCEDPDSSITHDAPKNNENDHTICR